MMSRMAAFERVDLVLLSCALILSGIGIGVIHSASGGGGSLSEYAARQTYWLMVGVAAYFMGFFVQRRYLLRGAYLFYGAVLIVLFGLAVTGKVYGGVHRWISFGGLTIQPSEIAKITLVLALARYFHDRKARPPYALDELIVPILIASGYILPIILQPDLGTAMFLGLISMVVILFVGVKVRTIGVMVAAAGVSAPFLFFTLKDYQQERILNFFNPGRDPLGTGYHVVQSKIAIGSGGFLGKGFMEGTQSQLRFIPEQHTDFIISVLGEEFGFLGMLVVISLLLFLSLWLLSYMEFTRSRFGMLTVIGISCAFAIQSVINISMTVGILPVVGLPLPLVSYGGSSLVSTWLGFGIIAGYRRRR